MDRFGEKHGSRKKGGNEGNIERERYRKKEKEKCDRGTENRTVNKQTLAGAAQ